MFSIFLFLIVFCFYNWLVYEPQLISDQQQHTEFAATKTIAPVQSTLASPVQLDNEGKVPEMPIIEAITAPFIALTPNDKLVLSDIATLKIRSARKAASVLGIRQKKWHR